MNPAALIPADVGVNAAIAICAVAFVSGTARGFSGFGSALIFMPLASSIADPRLVAALLLIIDFVAAAPLVPGAWQKADRKSVAIAVTIQPREKTLTDQEIDAVAAKIVAEVTKKTGGTLRA